jgi:octaprenyl-diphosphate synthase
MSSETSLARTARASDEVLPRLERVLENRGADPLIRRLAELQRLVATDLAEVEEALQQPRPSGTPIHLSARHLLALEGKRLRPTCVALASRVGLGFGVAARELAIAAELVHNATLLHDDVVDLGDRRRGRPTARLVYGNAASIFAGDFLLVEALERVCSAGIPVLLERAFAVLKEMLDAESLQLANRGVMRGVRADYFRVAEGKTASLFGWALYAGARAGGCAPAVCEGLETYGRRLGVAFQVVDDMLDVAGAEDVIGKSVFTDLREGKITHPLLIAIERDEALAAELEAAWAAEMVDVDAALARRVGRALRETHALEDTMALATKIAGEASAALEAVPAGPARDALDYIAVALPHRRK